MKEQEVKPFMDSVIRTDGKTGIYHLANTSANLMEEKLKAASRKGRHGWWNIEVIGQDQLTELRERAIEEGDHVSVLNYTAMLIMRESVVEFEVIDGDAVEFYYGGCHFNVYRDDEGEFYMLAETIRSNDIVCDGFTDADDLQTAVAEAIAGAELPPVGNADMLEAIARYNKSEAE